MIILRVIVVACIILFNFNQSVNSFKCYVCSSCEEPFSPNSNSTRTKECNERLGCYCVKVWTRHYVRREASDFCPEFNVGGTGIWCCQSNLCNVAPKLISTISLIMILIATTVLKFF